MIGDGELRSIRYMNSKFCPTVIHRNCLGEVVEGSQWSGKVDVKFPAHKHADCTILACGIPVGALKPVPWLVALAAQALAMYEEPEDDE